MPTARIDDTLEMYYEDDAFTDPWATPEVVLLHHGNFKSSQLWYSWVPLLARDYRVLRLDARGFGRSTAPPPGSPQVHPFLDHWWLSSLPAKDDAVVSLSSRPSPSYTTSWDSTRLGAYRPMGDAGGGPASPREL